MSEDPLRETLQAEYFYLQKVIEDFDARALTIKAWSISFSLAAIAGAFASHAWLVFLVAFVSALLFWFLEAVWKSFQLGYYQRCAALEKYFAGDPAPVAPLQIGATWFDHWRSGGSRQWTRIMAWPHVALPHAVVVIIGALLFALSAAGLVTP